VAAGFASWLKPAGARQTVILVGADTGVGPAFPTPRLRPSDALVPEAVLVDRSNQEALRVSALPSTVEIGSRRAQVLGAIDGFSSFVGTPYVFTSYREAHRYLGLRSEDTVFLLVKLVPDRDLREVARGLRVRLPDADVWTRQEFSWRAQTYWLTQTGAGGAILTAAVLGFLVGLVVVSQNIYATTLESLDEFATLKAMGATRGYVQRLVLFQALLSGVLGSALGLLATFPLVAAIASGIPWIYTPIWLPPAMMAVSLLMCGLASIASVRKAVSVEPARVFRA
jgi:putative ABC transport system permease protein